jgi:hypothetical protein
MELWLNDGDTLDNRERVVIWGAPCVGNVGQLAVDAILASLAQEGRLKRLGAIESDFLFPVTGRESYTPSSASRSDSDSSFLCMPMEVYMCTTTGLIIIQQRSAMYASNTSKFSQNLKTILVDELNCKKLIIACGAEMNNLSEMDIFTRPYFLACDNSSILKSYIDIDSGSWKWISMPLINIAAGGDDEHTCAMVDHGIDGAADVPLGLPIVAAFAKECTGARALHLQGLHLDDDDVAGASASASASATDTQTEATLGFTTIIVGKFCQEGDNRSDGLDLAQAIGSVVDGVQFKKISQPASWKFLGGQF